MDGPSLEKRGGNLNPVNFSAACLVAQNYFANQVFAPEVVQTVMEQLAVRLVQPVANLVYC